MIDLVLPTPTRNILTSPFGWRMINGHRQHHCGIDIGGQGGTPIYAAADGTVTQVLLEAHTGGYGDLVHIHHHGGEYPKWTVYAHLQARSTQVRVGQQVKAGDHIAGMGTTGFSTGVHLHFELNTTAAISTRAANDINPLPHIIGGYEWAFAGLVQGHTSPRIRALQRLLNALICGDGHPPLPATDFWGDLTSAAMRVFCGSDKIEAFLEKLRLRA